MDFEKFLALNRNRILGYILIAWLSGKSENLEVPFPPDDIPEDHEEELKSALNECMPLYNMMIDLWEWDIRFERELSNDWYFYSLFDGFVKSPISALRAISQNFTYAKYAAFYEIAQALILNFLQSRQIETFYECIRIEL